MMYEPYEDSGIGDFEIIAGTAVATDVEELDRFKAHQRVPPAVPR